MEVRIIKEKITKEQLKKIAEQGYNSILKAVVDVEKEIIALGGELHSDANILLIKKGSQQKNIWGINLYLNKSKNNWIEFISLINIRPSEKNLDMEIKNQAIKEKIMKIVNKLIER